MKRRARQYHLHYRLLLAFTALSLDAHSAEHLHLDSWTGEGAGVGNFLFPQFHYQAAAGGASTDPAGLAVGHHDPDRRGVTQQNIEFDLSLKLGTDLSAFVAYVAKIDGDDHWADEFEEYYATIGGLPLDARIKSGQFFPRLGYQQEYHPHDFVFVDQYLVNGRLIGEDSLVLRGGQIALPVLRRLPSGWDDRLHVAFGAVSEPEEEHGHEHEEEAAFEGEGAFFDDWALTANYTLSYAARSDVRYEGGLSFATGRNRSGGHTRLYGLHLEYFWRPDGVLQETHGWERHEFIRWRTEFFARHYGLFDEEGRSGQFSDFGMYTALSYGFPNGKVQAHLRGEYVSGVAEAGLGERWRVSPALSWSPHTHLPISFKLQYNYDHSPDFGEEHSVWAQFNFDWGDERGHMH